ncbi:hypothetical protein [Rhodococcus sp. CH91]|uniref:hypothetical protein n=1 Tax=Rhodococcus sp. CH91 TaxID=2910256 RepID=UPI001F4BB114|nr:hypothetical protein [Rhodococcus sp. CH91]
MVGPPGSSAIMTVPGGEKAYTSKAGPTWRNEVRACVALRLGLTRPARLAPPAAARRTAAKAGAGAELREYPIDHFDVTSGYWQQQVSADQIAFLRRVLTPTRPSRSVPDS